MLKKFIKYGVLILLGYFILEPLVPIGDYCSGLLNAINFIFFGGLLILLFIILTIVNLYQKKKRNQKFDFTPLLLTVTIFATFYFLSNLEESKFWTKKKLLAMIEVKSTPKGGDLFLYKNGTFAATLHSADFSCTYQGQYKLANNRLTLERKNLEFETEKVFTTEYIVDEQNEELIPKNKNFGSLAIIDLN